ncbi:MAG: isoamylase early set domain-containing protein [Candidatus Omnitrophica bacterium]|nr:isoamylase early set domain-containing protein [Candidatus Omnitrophota bacterium]
MVRLSRVKSVEFKLFAPQAKRVNLAGSFNNWDAKELAAKKDTKGNWMVKLNLKPGRYEYKFIVDGSWVNDPKCGSCVPNAFGTKNCVIDIK